MTTKISREFLKAAEEQGLGYLQLKTMARNSLHYSFVAGVSLWSNARNFVSVSQCKEDVQAMTLVTNGCKKFMAGSEKARLQWKLELEFATFENGY